MTDYTKTTDFAAKDSLPSGDANKVIRGTEFDTEFNNIATASATKADLSNPSFQGDVSVAGNILINGTVDGRDVAADGTKLDTVETNADVTDTANVTAAGAVMDSELTDEAAVKALDQGVATTDSPTFVGLTTTETATISGNAFLLGTGFSNDQTTDIQSLIDAAVPYSTIRLIGEFSYTALTISTEGLTLVVDGVLKQFSTTTESNSGYIQLNANYVNIEGGQFDGNTTPSVIVKINTGADYCTVRNAVFKNINVDNTMVATSGDFGAVLVSGDFARVENCTFTDLTNTQDPPNRINDSWPRGITILGDDCITNSLSFFRVQCPHTITGNRFQSFDAYMEEIEDNGYYLLGPSTIITNPVIINCYDEPFVFGAPSDDCRVLGGYIKNHTNAISFDRATNIVIDGLNVDSTACANLFKTRNTNTTYGQTITGITQASQAVVTANAHGLAAGVEITITGANPADYNGTYTVVSKTTNTLTLDLNSSSFGAYTASSATLTSEGQGCRNIKIRNLTAKVASLYEPIQFTAGTVRDFLLENSNIQYAYSKNNRSLRAKNITQALEAEVETPSINRFTVGMTVTIENATPSGYNGEFTVQSVVNNKKFTINLDSTTLGAYVEANNYGATVTAADVPFAGGADATDFSDGYFLRSSDMQDFIVRGNTFRITDGNATNEVTQYKFTPVSTNPTSLKVFSNNQIITESATGDTRMNVEYADFDSPFMAVQPSTGVIRDYENTLPMFWSTAAPSAGTFKEGTIIFNSDTDEGGNVGWVYVLGAWKPFSRIGDEGTVTADNFRTNSTNDGFNLFARNSSQTAVYIQQAGTGNILDLQTGSMDANAGVSRFLVDGSGNVGIGTSSPATELHVDSSTTTSSITLRNTTGTAGLDLVTSGTGGFLFNRNNDALVFGTNNSEKVRIDASGNVGIGTASPRTKLHVSGLTGDDDPALSSSTAPVFISNTADSYGLNIGVNDAGTSWLQSQSNTASIAYNISLNPLGGNVGIGTVSPSLALDVHGSGDTTIRVFSSGTGASDDTVIRSQIAGTTASNYLFFGDADDNNAGQIRYVHSDDSMRFAAGATTERLRLYSTSTIFYNGTTEIARFDNSNNLLVGTTTATNTVTVDGGIDAAGESFFGGSLDIRLNSSASNSIFEGNSSSMAVRNNGSNNINYELGGANVRYTMNLSRFNATDDNARELGSSAARWSVVYAATGTINTSDERLKQQVRDINKAEARVAVAAKGLLKAYKYNDAVEAKGDGARWHVGIIAQELKAAFEAEGLDAHEYGMFCWDEWWEADVWHEDDSLENGGYYQRETFDSEADAPEGAVRNERYSIRYEELLAFIIASI